MNSEILLVIPAYEPDKRIIELLKSLVWLNLTIIIVDDGSGQEFKDIFENANSIIKNNGVILTHEINKGKGAALKTAFSYILSKYTNIKGVVTLDSDGQHTVESIKKIVKVFKQHPVSLVLGVRQFDGDDVPWKSRFGNELTEKIFKFITGTHVSDTQTGLRGVPRQLMIESLNILENRFEFEIKMLLKAVERYAIIEVPIETVYDSKTNHQTHFNPIVDSIKIYKILCARFIYFLFSSLSSCMLDLALFAFFCFIFKRNFKLYILLSTFIARLISAIYNYFINYKFVFKSNDKIRKTGIKYFILAIFQMSLSAMGVTMLVKFIRIIPEVVIKAIVDTILFFISYKIQQKYVFKRDVIGEKRC